MTCPRFDETQFARRSRTQLEQSRDSSRFERASSQSEARRRSPATSRILRRPVVRQIAGRRTRLQRPTGSGRNHRWRPGGPTRQEARSHPEGTGKEREQKSRLSAPRSSLSAQTPIAVDSPPPPQRTVPETHYVPVEKDSFAKAHQWASEQVARKYPGATEVLQAQDSLIKQFMAKPTRCQVSGVRLSASDT